MALEDESHQQRTKHFKALQSVPTLPSEIVFEILVRLPVESLLRCRSVCKSWHSFISDSYFVKSHLSFSTTNNHYVHHRLILRTAVGRNLESLPLYDVIYDKSINPLEYDHPLKGNDEPILIGSYNGLVCIKGETTSSFLIIWNLSTRRSNFLPYCGWSEGACHTFGYDESTDDYKVVVVSYFGYEVKIYSLKSGYWKNICGFPHRILSYNNSGKFLNGAIHWDGSSNFGPSDSSSWTIFSLDLAKETYNEVLQPVYDEGHERLTLGVLGEWLCVICNYFGHGNSRADVWVMKVYGMKDSWTILVSIYQSFGIVRDSLWRSICIADGKILLQYGCELILYDPKIDSSSKIKNCDSYFQVHTFVESFVSPFPPPKYS